MVFKKDVVIYEKGETKVYINQCHNPGKKTYAYAVRKDSDRCLGTFLGEIKWNGAWRQYCFYPENKTLWSTGCLQGIIDFLTEINAMQRLKYKK